MNKDRRNRINLIYRHLEVIQEKLNFSEFITELEDILSDIETLKDEEREAFENLSENLQGGERGQAMEEAADALDEASSKVSEVVETLRNYEDGIFTEALEYLDNAQASGQ